MGASEPARVNVRVALDIAFARELVKLELGEIDFEWLAEFATRSLCEMYDEV